MAAAELNVVTGAFSYMGKCITARLLAMGKQVRTLTAHPDRDHPFGERVEAVPFNFDRPADLRRSLEGATTLYNTYWIRFPWGEMTFEKAVQNSETLFAAAEEAGVSRLVHISVTNPTEASPLPYFRGKALVEKAIATSKLSHSIIRPALLFGGEQAVLINNMAWLLRRCPVFCVFGDGKYRVQPIFLGDAAELAVEAGQTHENLIIDAIGPDTFTFDELLHLIAEKVGSRARIIHVNPQIALMLSRLINCVVRDVIVTPDEMRTMMSEVLVSEARPTGQTRLADWLEANAGTIGAAYISDLDRHCRQTASPARRPATIAKGTA